MTLEQWVKVEELFHRAAECDREERIRVLDDAGRTDPELRKAVESLLSCEAGAGEHLRAAMRVAADGNRFTLVGEMVSHYRILEGLGSGGMGVVYKAQDTKLPRFVALKFLPEDLPEDRAMRERFKREAYAASALNHPNICTVYELSEQEGHPFIAMELLEGETLREQISARLNKIDELLDLAIQMAEGLEAAHTKGITHRDIKPANLFLSGSGQLKILDFGIAKFQTAERPKLITETAGTQAPATATDETLTIAGTLIGTVAYMSPEQLSGMELDTRTDLFSCGAVLYEMATGVAPFQRETSALIREAILNEEPLSPARVNPHVPAELDRIIVKALEKNRQRRYQHAADMLVDLRRLLEAQARPKMRMRVLWITSAMLVAAAAGFWLLPGSHSETSPGIVERQVTANPPENWVPGAAVSPDGKTIAYHDQTGLYLRSVDTGVTHQVSLSPSFADRMLYLTWFPDGKKLLVPIFNEASYMMPGMWTLSTTGDAAPHLFLPDTAEGSVSPDGRSIVFITGQGLSISGVDGGPQRTVRKRAGDLMFTPVWSPDGRWIAYSDVWIEAGTVRDSIVVQPAAGGPAKTVVSETSLSAGDAPCAGDFTNLCMSWSPDWRLVFSSSRPGGPGSTDTGSGLWSVPLRPETGEAAGKPKRLVQSNDFQLLNPTVSADGKRLSFLKARGWQDVYLAELTPEGTLKSAARRFTLDDRGSYPNGWTPDSQAIIFSSDRTGTSAIFKQAMSETVAEAFVQSPEDDCERAVFTPDRSWILFRETRHRRGNEDASPARLMRRPAAGGPAETILQEEPADLQWSYECGTKPGSSCILSELEKPEQTTVVFYSLDPFRGKGAKLGQFSHLADWSGHSGWSLSPDATRIAYVTKQGKIEIMSVEDQIWHEISLPASWQQLQTVAWAADGKSLFVTCWEPDSSDLLQVRLNGQVTRLLHNGHSQWQWVANPLPSPDGKYLALQVRAWDSNVWMLENF